MTATQTHKQAIRRFLRTPVWTDEKLCQLLAHAESKLAFKSCCCLIGVANNDHTLRGENSDYIDPYSHYHDARDLPYATAAETAYKWIGLHNYTDETRRRILRPIIRAEIRRRDQIKATTAKKEIICDQALGDCLHV